MKLMFPKSFRVGALLSIAAIIFLFAGGLSAQSRKHAASKKAVAMKAEKQSKDARKGKLTAKERLIEAKSKKDPKKAAEAKKAAAERRRKEEERRQAILAEKRRREQAAREARARKLAFERGLRTETETNISNDKTEGEDLAIRRAAIKALGAEAGSVVVMEAQTGKILTIVNQNWAVRNSIRPCSTIKLVTATAGLNEGVISKEDGSIKNTRTRRNLDDAIAFSDNGYFQRVGSNLGNAKLVEYGKHLGLGEPTGINLDGETAGRLPLTNNNARIYSHGDDTEVSTLQLAVMVSAITNGGHRVLPRIPRNSVEDAKFQTFYKANVDLPQQNVRRMIPGMMGTAEYGTARRGVDHSLGIAGKTGSCIDKGSWVGLFTSVAPIESPKYAVAVITRGQHERGKYAAAVAGRIYQALSPQVVRTDRNLAQTEFHLKPKTTVDVTAATAKNSDDEEDDNADSGDVLNDAGKPATIVQYVPKQPVVERPAPKKLVTKTVNSAPVFPPVVITYDRDADARDKKQPNPKKPN